MPATSRSTRDREQQAEEVLRRLPDDATLEDIQYHLYVLEKIRKGQDDIAEGRSYTQSQAKERLLDTVMDRFLP